MLNRLKMLWLSWVYDFCLKHNADKVQGRCPRCVAHKHVRQCQARMDLLARETAKYNRFKAEAKR